MKRGNLIKNVSLLFMITITLLSSFNVFAESFNEIPKIEKEEITQAISRLDAVKIAKDFKMDFDGVYDILKVP